MLIEFDGNKPQRGSTTPPGSRRPGPDQERNYRETSLMWITQSAPIYQKIDQRYIEQGISEK